MDTVNKSNLRKVKAPERTCIGCRNAKLKSELIRIVGNKSGDITIAPAGKYQGRSAYMCKSRACWESGLKKDRLGLSLRMNISKEVRDELIRFGETLPR